MTINVSTENPEMARAIHGSPNWKSAELYPAESNGHKYKPGEILTLVGLRDFPEHNGEKVTITAIREDGTNGKAYYIEGAIPLNWVYEYRLSPNAEVSEPGAGRAANATGAQPPGSLH